MRMLFLAFLAFFTFDASAQTKEVIKLSDAVRFNTMLFEKVLQRKPTAEEQDKWVPIVIQRGFYNSAYLFMTSRDAKVAEIDRMATFILERQLDSETLLKLSAELGSNEHANYFRFMSLFLSCGEFRSTFGVSSKMGLESYLDLVEETFKIKLNLPLKTLEAMAKKFKEMEDRRKNEIGLELESDYGEINKLILESDVFVGKIVDETVKKYAPGKPLSRLRRAEAIDLLQKNKDIFGFSAGTFTAAFESELKR